MISVTLNIAGRLNVMCIKRPYLSPVGKHEEICGTRHTSSAADPRSVGCSSSYPSSSSAEKRTPFDNYIYNYYNWGKP